MFRELFVSSIVLYLLVVGFPCRTAAASNSRSLMREGAVQQATTSSSSSFSSFDVNAELISFEKLEAIDIQKKIEGLSPISTIDIVASTSHCHNFKVGFLSIAKKTIRNALIWNLIEKLNRRLRMESNSSPACTTTDILSINTFLHTIIKYSNPSNLLHSLFDGISSSTVMLIDRVMGSALYYSGLSSSHMVPLPNNQSLHILDFPGKGKGSPIILLHGISSCASDYLPLITFLRKYSSRVVAVDLPGHGDTIVSSTLTIKDLDRLMITAISQTLSYLNIKEFNLVGNSLGGYVAAKYASTRPSQLNTLILISPAGAPLSKEELQDVRSLFSMDSIEDAAKFTDRVFGRRRLPFGIRHFAGIACRARARRPAVQRLLQDASIKTNLRPAEINRIAVPTLLIWGEKEKVFRTHHLEYFCRHMRQEYLTLWRPSGVGHIPHLDPSFITSYINKFITSSHNQKK